MNNIEFRPTDKELNSLRFKEGNFKVSGDGIFLTRQGEGATAGLKAVFLRLQMCNLACGFYGGWKCDTSYTWDRRMPEFWREPYDLTYQQASAGIELAWSSVCNEDVDRRLVITGGEPLMQQDGIVQLRKMLPGWHLEIETNGTIQPSQELSDVQFNCSPKLNNSGNYKIKRYKPNVIRAINELSNSFFKFVVVSPLDFEEIDGIVEDCNIKPAKILIMPEGQTAREVDERIAIITPMVKSRNWVLTKRNQLIWYGPKRRT